MLFLIVLVLIIVLVYQNGRINRIEQLLKAGKLPQASTPASVPAPLVHPDVKLNSLGLPVQSEAVSASETATVVAGGTPQRPVDIVSEEESSGRILGRMGIAAVVIGMGFFLKYAFDNNWIGPGGRVMIGILIGIGVMALAQWLRKKYIGYSDLLMGGGMAILYLSIYSSYGHYHLVDPMMAFLGMIVVTAVGVVLSIVNATMVLSIIAFIGGFLTPFFIGPEVFDSWIVFTYITILNAGILGISLYKKWPQLVLVGLIGTWLYFGWWLATTYTDKLLIPTLMFLLIQYLIFTASAIARIIVEKIKATEVDYFVLGATAFSFALVCYSLLMPEYRHHVAIGAVLVAGFYTLIALMSHKQNPEDRTLNVFLPGLAVSFLTVAVPIEFSGPWVAAWWLVEALILYIVASSSSSRGFQIMGVIVYMLGLCDVFWYIFTYHKPVGYTIFFNGPFIMLMFAVVVAYAIAFTYYRYGSTSEEVQKRGIMVFVVLANVLTLYALTSQIIAYYELRLVAENNAYAHIRNLSNTTVSILWAMYAALLTIIGFIKRYVAIRRMGLILFIITAFKVVVDVWNLGELYRIISFIVFGIIALVVSFLYVRFKDRLKEIV